jgi:hypothetical protein
LADAVQLAWQLACALRSTVQVNGTSSVIVTPPLRAVET